jgi:hypothetical protein
MKQGGSNAGDDLNNNCGNSCNNCTKDEETGTDDNAFANG